ncbi:MAG: TolB family protein, partial [Candidatus Oleimicrobiaceae bacterium]
MSPFLPLLALLVCTLQAAELPIQVTTHPADDLSPSLSPDGRWVAFTSRRSGNLDIWVRPMRGGRAYQITTHQADDFAPAWSPDGQRLAFVSKRSDAAGDIWMVEVRRTDSRVVPAREPIRLTNHLGQDCSPCFSPDGKELAFCSDRSGRLEIWVLVLAKRILTRATFRGGTEPSWSPDGMWLAYTAFDSLHQHSAIAVTPAHPEAQPDLPRESALTDGSWLDCQPAWSPSGGEVVFCRFPYDTN